MLTVRALEKSYPTPQGPLPVLRGVDLDLRGGESLALTGESGSGKSTLLHLVAGLDSAEGGSVLVDGLDIARASDAERARIRRDRLGIVFQQFNLIPSLSVGANLGFHARLAGRPDPDWERRLAERLGLAETLDRWPEQLSGGQQQRLAIGRAMAARPRLLLADEPTGNLDEETAEGVIGLIAELIAETGAAFLMVTHSIRLAGRLDRRLHLSGGRIAAPAAAA